MFNTTHHHHSHAPRNLTVVEKRAPTDDSIRLLDEMEQKVIDRIIAQGTLKANRFTAKWYAFRCCYSRTIKIGGVYHINENERKIETSIDEWNERDLILSIGQKVREAVINDLSVYLVEDMFTTNTELRDAINGGRA